MIDIHCHILPALDDGPADLDAALAMARVAWEDGTRQLVATPHVGASQPAPEDLFARVAELNRALRQAGIGLEIIPAAENQYHLGRDLLSRYRINDGPYLLIEFPHTHLPTQAQQVLFELLSDGLIPIISHPERNPSIIHEPKRLVELVEQGGLVQVTADSLTGGFGPSVQQCARYLLKQGWVHFLASDGHSADWRPPVLSAGLKVAKKLIGRHRAENLVVANPRKVLRGEQL